ncbi:hypothetical protein ACJRO7_007450 [Eucalyptus globulus]|uniref:Cysteine-rich transmembrane domain-containing protein n=1 Tax=Eucalyptus globulus TaxID=34317 RepID=A0ABD3IL82_EUCGL
MPKSEAQQNRPPPGYPTDNPPHPRKRKFFCCSRTKMKGDYRERDSREKAIRERSFIDGCMFALCCCWLCQECCAY